MLQATKSRGWLSRILGFFSLLDVIQADTTISSNKVITIPLIPHHVQKRRRSLQGIDFDYSQNSTRRLQSGNAADHVAELYEGYGRQTVIVDTGSGVTAFPCAPHCTNCGVPDAHIDTLFVPKCSSSFRTVPCDDCLYGKCHWYHPNSCGMVLVYSELSGWRAYEAEDQTYMGGLHTRAVQAGGGQRALLGLTFHSNNKKKKTNPVVSNSDAALDPRKAADFSFPLKFGCQTFITGLFKLQLADGIMGLDRGPAAWWRQASDAHGLARAFSLCFARPPGVYPDASGTEAGALSIGGTDPHLHKSPMVYAHMLGGGHYYVKIRHIYLQSSGSFKRLGYKSIEDLQLQNTIVDSGTTMTAFNKYVGEYFEDTFREMMGYEYSTKIQQITREEIAQYPTIVLQLYGKPNVNQKVREGNDDIQGLAGDWDPDHPDDILLFIPPSHYFQPASREGSKFAASFRAQGTRSVNIIGADAMMGYDILFDTENHSMGWAKSDCDYDAAVNKYSDIDRSAQAPVDVKLSQCVEKTISNMHFGFCTGYLCQFGFASVFLLLFYCCFGGKRAAQSQEYEHLSTSELEMQMPPSALGDEGYRDDASDDELSSKELS